MHHPSIAALSTALMIFLFSTSAVGFCGFYAGSAGGDLYNDATSVVLMRDGTRTVMSMQNDYQGPVKEFALVIPFPQVLQRENVSKVSRTVFDRVDKLASPRLVEYWEQDPCPSNTGLGLRGTGMGGGGFGYGSVGRGTVEVKAFFTVAEYDIFILGTNDSTALDQWLRDRKYNIPKGAQKHFEPYVQQGQYFLVARVNVDRVKFDKEGRASLSPLRFHYDSGDFRLPVKLGLINSRGTQDLIVHILAKNARYEAGNYPNVTIPTNLELEPTAKKNFGGFYKALFDRVVENNPGSVVTEYSWQATKCDPCPDGVAMGSSSGGLSNADLLELGGSVIGNFDNKKTKKGQTWSASPWTLTRLHTRYSAASIGEDLVFRKAKNLRGGIPAIKGSHAKTGGKINQFQGRYIIRHPWKGPMKCKKPRRGVWGGPIGWGSKKPNVSPAPKIAYIKKTPKLKAVIKGKLPASLTLSTMDKK